jgi:hypothetical protein
MANHLATLRLDFDPNLFSWRNKKEKNMFSDMVATITIQEIRL